LRWCDASHLLLIWNRRHGRCTLHAGPSLPGRTCQKGYRVRSLTLVP
jgi:hypothetical protein